MELALLAIAVGVGVGLVVGALGAGGGILAVPVLVFLLSQDPHAATASSLLIVLITALFSIPHHARKRNVAWRDGLVFAGVSVVGAVLGSRLSVLVDPTLLLILFGSMLTVVAIVMLRRGIAGRRQEDRKSAAHGTHEGEEPLAFHDDPVLDAPGPDTVIAADGTLTHHGETDLEPPHGPTATVDGRRGPRLPWVIAAASLTGFLTGFFGVGGGFIVVPMLVIALGLAMRRASGTSLLVMIVTTAASLLARIGTDVSVDWTVTLLFAAGSAVGGMLGGPLSAKARASTLTLIFAALLGGVAAVTLGNTLLG
ncbi:sulfite exporter TauE/SafE family protein [Brachybacterium muris]|uniref:sulfite exporter TauE/SafE family protein n=1 Tax=Brachybacterium muris TaxID=219301 RepID=UPI00223B5E31|nr:sulfite exporter TauE/SafE family protein [Brachybacterium muris]MCT2260068.1 sulfite exporter TauE/SafE family protein [Brachybacterium muris]